MFNSLRLSGTKSTFDIEFPFRYKDFKFLHFSSPKIDLRLQFCKTKDSRLGFSLIKTLVFVSLISTSFKCRFSLIILLTFACLQSIKFRVVVFSFKSKFLKLLETISIDDTFKNVKSSGTLQSESSISLKINKSTLNHVN